MPVYKAFPGKFDWSRIPYKCNNFFDNDRGIKFSFKFTFSEGMKRVYFAYSFPWSFQDNSVRLI